ALPRPRRPCWLSCTPGAADGRFVSGVRAEGDRATNLAPVAPGGTARLMGLRPGPPLRGHHDPEPSDPPLGTVPGDPPQLVGDVIEVRPGEARGAVVPGVAVEAAEDRIADVRMLDRPAGPLEGLLVAVGDPVRLAILRLKRIDGPADGHLAGPLADEPRSAVPHEEPVRLAVVGLHGG